MAKQTEDTRTIDFLETPKLTKQQRFCAEQKRRGLRQVNFWMTPEQESKVRQLLEKEKP